MMNKEEVREIYRPAGRNRLEKALTNNGLFDVVYVDNPRGKRIRQKRIARGAQWEGSNSSPTREKREGRPSASRLWRAGGGEERMGPGGERGRKSCG